MEKKDEPLTPHVIITCKAYIKIIEENVRLIAEEEGKTEDEVFQEKFKPKLKGILDEIKKEVENEILHRLHFR